MIRKIVTALILVPLAVVIVLVAMANRQMVTVSLDPFLGDKPALAVTLPLFLLILVALTAGVIVGGVAAWLRQGKWRRAARRAESEAATLRAVTDDLKQRLDTAERMLPPPASVAAIAYRRPPAA